MIEYVPTETGRHIGGLEVMKTWLMDRRSSS